MAVVLRFKLKYTDRIALILIKERAKSLIFGQLKKFTKAGSA